MVQNISDGKEHIPLEQRKAVLEHYYDGTIYGKLHIWTHERIAANGWFEYEWWDNVSNEILVDMQRNFLSWKFYRKFAKSHTGSRKWDNKEDGAELWWAAHNETVQRARKRNNRYFRLMPFIVQEQTGLMLDGALSWKIDGLRPWKVPSKWIQLFM